MFSEAETLATIRECICGVVVQASGDAAYDMDGNPHCRGCHRTVGVPAPWVPKPATVRVSRTVAKPKSLPAKRERQLLRGADA